MATQKEIESLTVEEFMDALDYAVKKKKRRLIEEMREKEKRQPSQSKTSVQSKHIKDDEPTVKEQPIVEEQNKSLDAYKNTVDLEQLFENDSHDLRKNQKESSLKDGKLKTWKLISGILSIVLSIFVLLQSFFAGFANLIFDNGEVSGSIGVIVAILLLIGGIVSIVVRNSDKIIGNIALMMLFAIASLLGFLFAGHYQDLYIWSSWCLLNCFLAVVSLIKMKS